MEEKSKKNILKTKNPEVDLQASQKFQDQIRKNKENIERKYEKSITNKLYIFPRFCPQESTSTDSENSDEEEICLSYDLKTQNMKNRK